MYVKKPEQFETPDWVKHFIEFIICKDLKEWQEKKKWLHGQNLQKKDNI